MERVLGSAYLPDEIGPAVPVDQLQRGSRGRKATASGPQVIVVKAPHRH